MLATKTFCLLIVSTAVYYYYYYYFVAMSERSTVTVPPDNWTSLVSVEKPDPTRHIYIHHGSQSIKGTYAISPLAENVYPPVYDMPKEHATRHNTSSATFETKNSAIGATVWITGKNPLVREPAPESGKPKGKPVSVEARSNMGSLKLVIVSIH